MEGIGDRLEILPQPFISENFFRVVFLGEEIDQLNHRKKGQDIATMLEQFDKLQEWNPNIEKIISLENTKILEAIMRVELRKMQNLWLHWSIEDQLVWFFLLMFEEQSLRQYRIKVLNRDRGHVQNLYDFYLMLNCCRRRPVLYEGIHDLARVFIKQNSHQIYYISLHALWSFVFS